LNKKENSKKTEKKRKKNQSPYPGAWAERNPYRNEREIGFPLMHAHEQQIGLG
jgi:hypothetical protein